MNACVFVTVTLPVQVPAGAVITVPSTVLALFI
jgi:hypothetical protein